MMARHPLLLKLVFISSEQASTCVFRCDGINCIGLASGVMLMATYQQ
jgi:hypothetical protein